MGRRIPAQGFTLGSGTTRALPSYRTRPRSIGLKGRRNLAQGKTLGLQYQRWANGRPREVDALRTND